MIDERCGTAVAAGSTAFTWHPYESTCSSAEGFGFVAAVRKLHIVSTWWLGNGSIM